jgi:glutamate racemase
VRRVTAREHPADRRERLASTPVDDAPIGIFDSGVGGLTVARAVLDLLPHEPVAYVGDTAHGPYGPLPLAQVRRHALDVMDHLVAHGVKLLVVACNSASAACLDEARERYDVPVVEVIDPAVRRAARATRNGRVGVIGTSATIGSGAYARAFRREAPDLELTSVACPRFVEFVERGDTTSAELHALAEEYLTPVVAAGVDTLVLGCTHYPLLAGVISWVVGDGVTLVSSAEETAKDVHHALARLEQFRDPQKAPPTHQFLATGDPVVFQRLGQRFLGPEIGRVAATAVGGQTLGDADGTVLVGSTRTPRPGVGLASASR